MIFAERTKSKKKKIINKSKWEWNECNTDRYFKGGEEFMLSGDIGG